MKRSISAATPALSTSFTLERAFAVYLERRKLHLKPRSIQNYQCHFRYLIKFFGASKRLETFHEGDFRDYHRWRSLDGPDHGAAGASCINHELNALAQVLALADLWHPISKYYELLPQKNWSPPRVLTAEEEDRFFRFARRRPEGQMAYLACLLTANSTISGCEIRQLQIQDLLLEHRPPRIHVPEAVKNRHRVRSVPLNEPALEAAHGLLTLAQQRGSSEPHHYLIPFRIKKGKYDAERPASSYFMRTSFRRIARSCGLDWITPTIFRHQAITKLLESGAPDETVRALAGQVSENAMRYYSHIRIEAKQEAVRRLEKGIRPKPIRSAIPTTGMLASVKAAARRLQIPTDAALELILEYERAKSG